MAKLMTNNQGNALALRGRRLGVACAEFQEALTDGRADAFLRSLVVPPTPAFLGHVASPMWVKFLADGEVAEKFQGLVATYRHLAKVLDRGYSGPVVAEVMAGFQWKQDAALYGRCYDTWSPAKSWGIQNDEPTISCLAFWVPRLVPESFGKTVLEKHVLGARLREQYGLPAHHLSGFGSMSLVTSLVLGYHNAVEERVPLDHHWAHTDTISSGGLRLEVGNFDEDGLSVARWDDVEPHDRLGFFALGVEPLSL